MIRRLVILILLIAVVAVAAVWWGYQRVSSPFQGFDGTETIVELPAGTSVRSMAERLAAAGVVRDPLTFRIAARLSGNERRLQAGEYRFAGPSSPFAVVERIARGDVFVRPITFREGLTIREMAAHVEASGFGTADAFMESARRTELIHDLDPDAQDLEGYLFPSTYPLARNTSTDRLVDAMVGTFRSVFTPQLRAEAEQAGLSVREVVTLASVVERETGHPDERPIVAAVFRNRLRLGMPLQTDPTVIYAMMLDGRWAGNIRRSDLEMDHPYNTYRNPGLPPGPIAAPGLASIEAVLRPADVSYLYFVSRNDGTHVFATTLAEHNRNVREWQLRRRQ
jgi:UPF0755 protein